MPGTIFDLAGKHKKIEEMEAQTSVDGFWDKPAEAQTLLKQIKHIRMQSDPWVQADKDCTDFLELLDMVAEEEDDDSLTELGKNADALAKQLGELELRALLSDELDANNTYLHVHAGAGGTESCDWAAMLVRMYQRWCERSGFTMEELDFTPGDEAGVKSATFQIKGDYAFGHLKTESGIHRLVRISPFDANARRHTSFASVFATPEVDDDINIEINEDDLRIDYYRSSGAGGQHVNKTSSAVRLTHIPTKIVVACQNERSQHKNKATAMKILKARLYQFELDKQKGEQAARDGEKAEIGWGSQIRSYVFQPYQLVKDLRTSVESGNIQAVMDGDIDKFIEAELRRNAGMSAKSEK
ncbi:TPA: peptide chain release factor 2 [Candidatus Sumerlaeota bacterium]|jgi:peptide chain release factor 2|nr:peptide chain release factor 2 [Candidatus Sumerlaeota bacterium]